MENNAAILKTAIVKSLKELLLKDNAHVSLADAVKDLPPKLRGVVPESLPYSIWQLVEHIRIAQKDILEFSRDPEYQSPRWPEGYWPAEPAPKNGEAWDSSLAQIKTDLKAFILLLEAPDAALFTPFAHGSGQHLFREAVLIADHTSYHTGEIVAIRRLLGAWK
ncbi:MAG TPA: DinB family protein [Chitinophaga sp.]|uniref:DinB family protein n=1 Tax=Chitinophaga sp. TaxID=1869181 RepID=UPI002C266F75|nr:DinB family protein [Chitinophaga sp.]HVI49076.1 DinB family protein [Chitinophaga sp.]